MTPRRGRGAGIAPIRGAAGLELSRRSVLRGMGLSAAAVGGASLLGACGTEGADVEEGSCVSKDVSDAEKTISFSNWIGYVDPVKRKDVSTLEKFQAETGITVEYATDINDNESFFAEVSPQLKSCKPTGRDIIVVTDWMAARMIDLGWIQELDHDNMPNVHANLIEFLASPDWDPDRTFSVPWQSGMTGICYNEELTDPVTSFEELLTRPDLRGKVELLSEMRDTMTFLLLMQDSDPSDFSDDEFTAAIEALQGYVDSGQVRRFSGNDYVDGLKSGDVVACEAWSGDVINLLGGGKYKWIPPDEGFSLWTDNMLVPNQAAHKTNAETLMNFYYDPVNAAQLAAWNYYFCPVQGAQEQIAQFDPDAADSEFIFLDDQTLETAHMFMALSESQEQRYQRQFNEVMGG